MDNVSQKIKISESLNVIKKQMTELSNQSIIRKLTDLEEDIDNDFFTIVILGEFKRGKSTFVNALLGENILPTDVIPTTATINSLMWSEEKKTYVVKTNGKVEAGESSLQFLNKYVASEDFDVDKIKYLKVGYPAEILKNNIVIVDTPGVSDINEHRVQVTYDFIPRADAVIFLLDATSPLKRTEKEFIDEHLIKLGIDRVLFIANKFDNIDEEDEEEVIEDIEKRLRNSFKKNDQQNVFKELSLVPMSSKMALEGVRMNDQELIIKSGMAEVKDKILDVVEKGSMAEEKLQRYKKRAVNIIEAIEREINNKIKLYKTDIDDLRKTLENMDAMIVQESNRKENIYDYIENEEQSIFAMVKKSLNFFQVNLKEEINESIDNYKGLDFKEYVERHISSVIKKSMNRWVSTYYVAIDKLLEKLEKEISLGLANYFKTRVVIQSNTVTEVQCNSPINYLINIEAEDISNVTTKAGLISAGAAGIMTLIGGPILLPFISMAAFPILQRKMLESKLNDAKISVKPEINDALNECVSRLAFEVGNNIANRIENIKQSTEDTYNQLFNSARNQIQLEIDRRQEFKNSINEKVDYLENKLTTLNELKNTYI